MYLTEVSQFNTTHVAENFSPVTTIHIFSCWLYHFCNVGPKTVFQVLDTIHKWFTYCFIISFFYETWSKTKSEIHWSFLQTCLESKIARTEGSELESWLCETSKMFNCSNKYNWTGNSSWKWLALKRTLNDERLKSVKLLPRRFNVSREELLKNSYVNVPLNLYLIDTHGLFVMD